jgi:predicted HicB family RNase H-like nuclease
MMPRKPLTFDVDRSPAQSATPSAPASDRKQVGARIRAELYRELKARAARQGVKVQELVEAAIAEFLAKQ